MGPVFIIDTISFNFSVLSSDSAFSSLLFLFSFLAASPSASSPASQSASSPASPSASSPASSSASPSASSSASPSFSNKSLSIIFNNS
ncbi:MAG: hypothetical protein EBT86_00310 [Actinobacteria bacterium]|nr:hypothetical protein [Actinomycetota bacterium]